MHIILQKIIKKDENIFLKLYSKNSELKYLEIKNRMFKTVLKRFRDSGINFAFPSRTLYMRNDEN